MKLKKILVPIDFSDNSLNALDWACDLAAKSGAQLHIFHAYEYTATYAQVHYLAFMETIAKSVEKSLLQDMKALEKKNSRLASLKPKYKISFEYAIKGIKDYIAENDIDLVIMGTRGNDDITNKLMGSITYSIIDHTNTPVLAIPEGFTLKDLKKIVFAIDYKHVTPKRTLNLIAFLAKSYKSSLKIFHVKQKEEEESMIETEEVQIIAEELKNIPYSYAFSINKYPHKGILEYLSNHEADLLVMIPHKHGFFRTIFSESTLEHVVHEVKIPLLAIQAFDD